jgi:acyl-coenzyme A synthetase/AMP-(fatty) acid ligase
VATLPPVKRPTRIVVVEELPRTATGKVDARVLRSIVAG